MRVAMLADYPQDGRQIVGGVQAVTVYLARALAELSDVDLHVITLDGGLHREVVQQDGRVTVYRVPTASRLRSLARLYLVDIPRLRRKARDLRPDLVHGQGADIYGHTALSTGLPSVVTLHGILREDARHWLSLRERMHGMVAGWLFEGGCVSRAEHLIAISPYILSYWGGRIKGRVHAVENPIDEAFFRLPAGEADPSAPILFAGVISPRKRLHHLLEALHRVRVTNAGVRLRVAGKVVDEAYYSRLLAWVRDHDMESHVAFLGGLDEERLLDEFRRCRMLVLPSAQETAPMVVEQAMATGKPVVATSVGGVPHLVRHEETGLLVEAGDVKGLAGAMARLLEDDDLSRRLGRSAHQQAYDRFRASLVAHQTRDVYRLVGKEGA